MLKGTELCFFFFAVSLFSMYNAKEFPIPEGYDWMTRGGKLYIKAGEPPRYLTVKGTGKTWEEHSWLVHNKPPPESVRLLPLSDEMKEMIVEEMNYRRAKTLLGAYFDPEKPTDFGIAPPASKLSKLEYSEDVARTTERYIQHFIFDHYNHNSFYPHTPMGEVLHMTSYTIPLPSELESFEDFIAKELDMRKSIMGAIIDWFDEELLYYKHYEPYLEGPMEDILNELFRNKITDDETLSEDDKRQQLDNYQFGHYAGMVTRGIHAVGCAFGVKRDELKADSDGEATDKVAYKIYVACNFGGGIPTNGVPLYDMDENILEQFGISKSQYAHSAEAWQNYFNGIRKS